nr:hypothetical protein [Tanacetum cinerariifolium]
MAAFLEKPEGSNDFHHIVDFLNSCHLRASKGYTGVDTPLFPTMIVQGLIIQGEGSTILIESQHTPTDEAASTSVDDRLTRDVYGAAFTKLIKKVKKLKQKVKSSQATKRSKVIIFEEESSDSDIFAQEDPSKQGRNLSKIDEDLDISLVQA